MTGRLSFSLGVVLAAFPLAGLGAAAWGLAVAVVTVLNPGRAGWPLLWVFLGGAWLELHLAWHLNQRDRATAEPGVVLVGEVTGLPVCNERGCGFLFQGRRGTDGAVQYQLHGAGIQPEPGQHWRLYIQPRASWALRNPGGFDGESRDLANGTVARGRVSGGELLDRTGFDLDRLRFELSSGIHQELGPGAPLLQALAVGDRRGMQRHHWSTLQATGTSHLMAISGLHVGLVAGLGLMLGRGIHWLWPRPGITANGLGTILAAVLAFGYAGLAGFSVPTVRALVMLLLPAWALLLRRSVTGWLVWSTSLALALLVSPLSILQGGLWLSYGAVAVLIFGLSWPSRLPAFIRAQWVVLVGLLPLLAGLGLPLAPLGLLVNCVAIPWVGALVVPPLLLSLMFTAGSPPHGFLLAVADRSMDLLWQGLIWVASLDSHWTPGGGPLLILLWVGAALLILSPRGLPGRGMAVWAMAWGTMTTTAAPKHGELWIRFFDVGQGSAVLLQTQRNSVLYDTGPGNGHWSAAASQLVPYLRQNVPGLDRIMVSHRDLDHAGGVDALRGAFPAAILMGGGRRADDPGCHDQQQWRWDGVDFRVLHPSRWLPYLGNDSSCVLLVKAGGAQLLLPGDVGRVVEQRLLHVGLDPGGILAAAHHGSRSSSSLEFLRFMQPERVVISAGRANRFGLPHPEVVDAFRDLGVEPLNTAECGWIGLEMSADGGISLTGLHRPEHARPWHQPGLCRLYRQPAQASNQAPAQPAPKAR